MNEQHCDLTQSFYKEVNNLMFVINKIIEAYKQHNDITLFMNDLSIYYESVKNIQLEKENFDRKIRNEIEIYSKTTNSNIY